MSLPERLSNTASQAPGTGLDEAPPVLWRCPPDRLEQSSLAAYERWLARNAGLEFEDYNALWRWSVGEPEAFWESIWRFFEVRSHTPYTRVLDSQRMPGARWFAGATLNFAEHCLRDGAKEGDAIIGSSELRALETWDWTTLRARTAAVAGGLRSLGVGPGDRVAAYLPNIPEAVAAFLACASIGAVWSACSPDFGAPAVIDRFRQIEPRVMLAVDGYRYGGRDFDRMATVAELRRELPTVTQTVMLDYLGSATRDRGALDWRELEALGEGEELYFSPVPFEHPLWILYSSGTTGLPKPIVHGHGGVLLELLKLQHLQFDVRPSDRFFWFSTTGWVMWNIVVSALLTGATIVTYDGNPGHPDLNCLWSMADVTGVSCFGASAAFLSSCVQADVVPLRAEGTPIRSIGSTGSPLPPEAYRWVYREFPADTWLFSVSGGTDVATGFVGGALSVPVYEGEISARMLGVDVESWDEAGQAQTGRTGELVVTAPMPSMPLYLWGDDGSRLRASYFETYPGAWRHGDWIEITQRGTAIIRGRSDSTINRGGVRMGTSEIYRAVLSLGRVVDALAVDLPLRGDHGFLALFVVIDAPSELDDRLRQEIRERIRSYCSPRHVPDEINQVPTVPRTITGKVLELPIKRILMGEDPHTVVSAGSLADPQALEWFVRHAEALQAERRL
jgi:acetoacetyl-CoA synthetase